MDKPRFFTIGRVVGAHGIHGTLKVFSYAESIDSFPTSGSVRLKEKNGVTKDTTVRWVKPHGKTLLLSLKGITDREQAECLKDAELIIREPSGTVPEADAYYWSDLIGMSVLTENDDDLGRITSIIETGSNDVYVVQQQVKGTCREILVPALARVVVNVDVDRKTMHVNLPEGL